MPRKTTVGQRAARVWLAEAFDDDRKPPVGPFSHVVAYLERMVEAGDAGCWDVFFHWARKIEMLQRRRRTKVPRFWYRIRSSGG